METSSFALNRLKAVTLQGLLWDGCDEDWQEQAKWNNIKQQTREGEKS